MTGPEFRKALIDLGVSAGELARDLGVTPSTVSGWARERNPVPSIVAAYLDERMRRVEAEEKSG